ncbi:hypothetical protein [Streptomyces sp. NPDC020742]|uniref:hypothetical protein n=1 Tax=unclassified Streptomyces TaxID=2593676 RepID=UPI00340B1251
MKLIPGDLAHQVLASTRHHYQHHYHSDSGSYGSGIDGWEWLIVLAVAAVVIWALVKKFSAD